MFPSTNLKNGNFTELVCFPNFNNFSFTEFFFYYACKIIIYLLPLRIPLRISGLPVSSPIGSPSILNTLNLIYRTLLVQYKFLSFSHLRNYLGLIVEEANNISLKYNGNKLQCFPNQGLKCSLSTCTVWETLISWQCSI